jgi:methylated-DNA-[protein]-cysteine S-methyltransferase
MDSPVGPIALVASERGLLKLHFDMPAEPFRPEAEWLESRQALLPYIAQLERYFAGELQRFTLPLDLRGTGFQKRCWEALLRIPYGQTRSYAEIAREVGLPRAPRAVGQANHHNPIAIIVPCHRVIESNGGLGGYGGGLDAKRLLLRLEGAILA